MEDTGNGAAALRVSTRSSPTAVAGAMAAVVRRTGSVSVEVIGAGALNQAVKAVAIARGYLAFDGIDIVCIPSFADVEIDGDSRTGICLEVTDRHPAPNGGDALAAGARVAVST